MLILDWAMHEYTEKEREGVRPFSWKGRSLARVLERSIAYASSRTHCRSDPLRNKHGWDWVLENAPGSRWSFLDLTSGSELHREGQNHGRCVGRYSGRCASGHSAIVSLRFNKIPRLTIEIDPRSGSIVQVKDKRNRSANEHENEIIRQWQRAVLDAAPLQNA